VLRLGLTLLAIALTFRYGYQAVRRHEHSSSGGLAVGALLAFSTLAIHSFGEFGVHVPSIAVLSAVLGAHLCALGSPAATEPAANLTDRTGVGEYTLRLGGLAPVASAVVLLLLGWALLAQEWVQARVQVCWRAAWKAAEDGEQPDSRDRQLAYLTLAADMAPAHARLLVELARAHLDLYEEESERLDTAAESDDGSQEEALARLEREHLIPALSHYLQARGACPLMGQPHVRIAANIDSFERADLRTTYLDRAKLLVPWDPELWYICGVQELLDGQQSRAWASWRRSLDLSDRYFQQIVDGSVTMLKDEDLLEQVLPDRPELLVRAATHLHPKAEQSQKRDPFLKKAQLVWQSVPPERLDAQQWYFKALIDRNLGNWQEAVSAYEHALALGPSEVDWRYELAELHYQREDVDSAHRELVTILRQRPEHSPAQALYGIVSRLRAERR
jgi:tetratricopeptide (TPR) repeat protein